MDWVYVYLTLTKNVPTLNVGKNNYRAGMPTC
jgi:hypothetical protein